jgi:hypothetical protein
MSWYVIVWREAEKRRMVLNVPGLQAWCESTVITRTAPSGLVVTTEPRPVELEWLLRQWDQTFGTKYLETDGSDTLWGHAGTEYSARTTIVPEHAAPKLEYWGCCETEDDFDWVIELPNGKTDYRKVLSISQHADVGKAWDQAKKDVEHWLEKVEEFDTEEWQQDRERMRLDYANFRHWVTKTYGVTPPDPEPIGPGERGFSEWLGKLPPCDGGNTPSSLPTWMTASSASCTPRPPTEQEYPSPYTPQT